jgi:hypothetical protein
VHEKNSLIQDFCVIKNNTMQTQESKKVWGSHSVSFWMTLLVGVGIIFIGGRFMITPSVGAAGYGIPLSSAEDLPYGRIKGIRDIFSGMVLIAFLFLKMRRAAAFALTAAIIVPATDFCIVLSTNGARDLPHLLIHGLTVVYMTVAGILLFQKYKGEIV